MGIMDENIMGLPRGVVLRRETFKTRSVNYRFNLPDRTAFLLPLPLAGEGWGGGSRRASSCRGNVSDDALGTPSHTRGGGTGVAANRGCPATRGRWEVARPTTQPVTSVTEAATENRYD